MGALLGRPSLAELPVSTDIVPFSEFLAKIAANAVSKVVFRENEQLEFVTEAATMSTRVLQGLSTQWVVQKLLDSRTPFSDGRAIPSLAARRARGLLVLLVPALYLYLAYHMMKKLTNDSESSLVEQRKKRLTNEAPTPVTWAHVAGIDSARRELQEVVDFLKNPTRFVKVGARCPRGVLLSGPPGCGKTLLARAAAHEAGVNIIVCSASDFVEVFVGRGSARIRDLFNRAERCAPCILFFDELDALAKARSAGGFGNDEREQTLNQLLTEMDGFNSASWGGGEAPTTPPAAGSTGWGRRDKAAAAKPRGPVVVIAATNRPDVLDPALVRPGRFDRHVRVPTPTRDGREEILRVHVERRRVPVEPGHDLVELARCTENFSGAELGNVVNEACLLAVRDNREVVKQKDLLAAVAKCKDSRSAQFSSPRSSFA